MNRHSDYNLRWQLAGGRILWSIVLFFSMGLQFIHSTRVVADVALNHDDYCKCGTNCRREKCCCKPPEKDDAESTDPTSIKPGQTESLNSLYCRLTSPCSDSPASSDVRGPRLHFPPKSPIQVVYYTHNTSEFLLFRLQVRSYHSDYLSSVDRPPESAA